MPKKGLHLIKDANKIYINKCLHFWQILDFAPDVVWLMECESHSRASPMRNPGKTRESCS